METTAERLGGRRASHGMEQRGGRNRTALQNVPTYAGLLDLNYAPHNRHKEQYNKYDVLTHGCFF